MVRTTENLLRNSSLRSPKVGVEDVADSPVTVRSEELVGPIISTSDFFRDSNGSEAVPPVDASLPPESGTLPKELFDKLDYIVFEVRFQSIQGVSYLYIFFLLVLTLLPCATQDLRSHHWSAFQSSQQWIKYFKFIALSERKVTDDDFTLFRILGRGG